MRIAMVSPLIGEAFGEERVMRDSSSLLRQAGHQVFFLATARQGPLPPRDGFKLVRKLESLDLLASDLEVKSVVGEGLAYLEELRPDVVHFIDLLDHRFMEVVCRHFPTLLTSHTVATTCPSSTRWVPKQRPLGSCTQKSGWSCMGHHYQYGCLSGYRDVVRRTHALYVYQLKRKAIGKVQMVGAISQYVKAMLIVDGWDEEKIKIIYNPIAAPSIPLRKSPAQSRRIVCACRLVSIKGIDQLIKAMALIPHKDYTLSICGDGPLRVELEALVRKLGLKSQVRFLGRLSYEKTQEVVASSRLLVQPNIGPEGFGLSIAEASALGVPVVANDMPALNEVIEHDHNGLLAKALDVQSLADQISKVLDDDHLCERLGQAGPQLVAERFSAKSHLEATLSAYEQCVELFKMPQPHLTPKEPQQMLQAS